MIRFSQIVHIIYYSKVLAKMYKIQQLFGVLELNSISCSSTTPYYKPFLPPSAVRSDTVAAGPLPSAVLALT